MWLASVIFACGPGAGAHEWQENDFVALYYALTVRPIIDAEPLFGAYARSAEGAPDDACPRVEAGGLGLVYSGGCNDGYTDISGSAETTDILAGEVFGFDATAWSHGEDRGASYHFDGHALSVAGDGLSTVTEVDLWSDVFSEGREPREYRSTGSVACDDSTSVCTLQEGFEAEVRGVGTFAGEGDYGFGDRFEGELRARSDATEVVFGIESGCIAIEVDGQDEGCVF